MAKMESFEYKGLTFKPLKRLSGKEDDFFKISQRISTTGITPEGYTYDEFYTIAGEHGARNIDLFEVNGEVIIAGTGGLFKYQ